MIMTKQEFLALETTNGLIVKRDFQNQLMYCFGISGNSVIEAVPIEDKTKCALLCFSDEADEFETFKPIIRHISTLTEPITHNGETFVPAEKLMWDDSYVEAYHKNGINVNEATFSDVLKLIKWHFWPDMPEGEEVVYVTEEFNPYK